jgi:hypothetical protein
VSNPLPDGSALFADWIRSEHGKTYGAFQFDVEDLIDYSISPDTSVYMTAMVDYDLVVYYLLNVRFRAAEEEVRNWLMVRMSTWTQVGSEFPETYCEWMLNDPMPIFDTPVVPELAHFMDFIDEHEISGRG